MIPKIELKIFYTNSGKRPFLEWLDKLDSEANAIIKSKLAKVRSGNLGDCKPIKNGKGVWELRIKHGPGYRIYYGKISNVVLLLLAAGDKGTQKRDILKAIERWLEYKGMS